MTIAPAASFPRYTDFDPIVPVCELRIDPHLAWDYQFKRIVFNGCDNGIRRVYLADLSSLL